MTDSRARRIGALLLASPVLVVLVVAMDARARRRARDADQSSIDAIARRLPTSDLALSGGARWLRAVSLEEPTAAFADGPAMPDPDPAGAAMAPPLDVWSRVQEKTKR